MCSDCKIENLEYFKSYFIEINQEEIPNIIVLEREPVQRTGKYHI
jgi:hypothetical protein